MKRNSFVYKYHQVRSKAKSILVVRVFPSIQRSSQNKTHHIHTATTYRPLSEETELICIQVPSRKVKSQIRTCSQSFPKYTEDLPLEKDKPNCTSRKGHKRNKNLSCEPSSSIQESSQKKNKKHTSHSHSNHIQTIMHRYINAKHRQSSAGTQPWFRCLDICTCIYTPGPCSEGYAASQLFETVVCLLNIHQYKSTKI